MHGYKSEADTIHRRGGEVTGPGTDIPVDEAILTRRGFGLFHGTLERC